MKVTDLNGNELRQGDMVTWKLSDDFNARFLIQDLISPVAAQVENQSAAPGKIILCVEIVIRPPESGNSVQFSDIVRSDLARQTEAAEPASSTSPAPFAELFSLGPILQMVLGPNTNGHSDSPGDSQKEFPDSRNKQVDEPKCTTPEGEWVN